MRIIYKGSQFPNSHTRRDYMYLFIFNGSVCSDTERIDGSSTEMRHKRMLFYGFLKNKIISKSH